jgi:hypothetical protein
VSSEARRRQLEAAGKAADENFSSADGGGGAAECRETDWLLIELRDSEGRPVPGARYVIELPDGNRVEGTLGDDGIAGVEGIDPGKCMVTFPDILADDSGRANSGNEGSTA